MSSTDVHPELADPRRFVARFFHPEKNPTYLRRGLTRTDVRHVAAALAGCDEESLALIETDLDRQARVSAGVFAETWGSLEGLPFAEGDTIVALGDSITDDSLSWAHQLSALLRSALPERGLTVINAGITGHTTQEAIARFDLVTAASPNWVIQMLGTNDARRHGRRQVRMASLQETERNLRELERTAIDEAGARVVVMTPPPVRGEKAETWAPFLEEQITWRTSDVDDIAELIRGFRHSVDVHGAFREHPDEDLLLPDGVHPTVVGQRLILATLLTALTDGDAGDRS